MRHSIPSAALAGLALLLALPCASMAQANRHSVLSPPTVSGSHVSWAPLGQRSLLRVEGPSGESLYREIAAGEPIDFSLDELGESIGDGEVYYTLKSLADVDEGSAFGPGSGTVEETQTGAWVVKAGQIQLREAQPAPTDAKSTTGGLQTKTQNLSITNEDLILTSSDVDFFLRDTTNLANAGHFNISIDESAANDFAIQTDQNGVTHSTGAIYPFIIQNAVSAEANSALTINDQGRIGMGIYSASTKLHIADDSPRIRLDDDSGTLYRWDISGTDTGFGIGTTGQSAAFFIAPDSQPSSLSIGTNGNVGIGTTTPGTTFDIQGNSGNTQLLVQERNADAAVEVMFNLNCNCAPGFRMKNTLNDQVWFFRHLSGGNFSFDDPNSAGQEMILTSAGSLVIKGTLSQGSSRALKENLTRLDGDDILDRLQGLDLYEWSYLGEGARHFGPMAEDFSALYGFGNDPARLAPGDMGGVALAAVKSLHQKNEDLATENQQLKRQTADMAAQLETVLQRLEALEAQQ